MAVKASRRQVATTVIRLLKEQPAKRKHILQATAAYLIDHGQANQWDLLVKDIARELEREDAYLFATVTSARPLSATNRTNVKSFLARAFDAKTVELDESVDTSLLSGLVITAVDQELDTTAKRSLKQLAFVGAAAQSEGVRK